MLPPYINDAGEHQAEDDAVYYRRLDQGIDIYPVPQNAPCVSPDPENNS
jgi:hypothetical protein